MQAYGICVCRILTLGTWGKKCTSMWLTQRTTVALFLITQFSVVRSQAYKSEHPVTALYKVCTTSTGFTYSYLFLRNTWCLFFLSAESNLIDLCIQKLRRLPRGGTWFLSCFCWHPSLYGCNDPIHTFSSSIAGMKHRGEMASFGRKPVWMMSIWWFFSRDLTVDLASVEWPECNSQKWERCRGGVIIFFFPGQVQVNNAFGVGGWVDYSVCNSTG